MSTSSDSEKSLQKLLKSLSTESAQPSTKDIELLATGLAPHAAKSSRSLAFICLSKLCETLFSEDGTKIAGIVQPYLHQAFDLGEEDVSPEHFIPATVFLANLFSLSPIPAVLLLTTSLGEASDSPDVLGILLESAELPSALQPALAELFASAAGLKQGRELVRARAEEWLRGAVSYQNDPELGVLCAVALSKLGREVVPGEKFGEEEQNQQLGEELALCKKMMEHITTSKPSSSSTNGLIPTLEGLSILSIKGPVKHLLISDTQFLKSLLALSPIPQSRPSSLPVTPRASIDIDERLFEPIETSLCYGLSTILVNLTSRKAILSAEDEQIAKLRAMAISGKKGGADIKEDPFDTDEAVQLRVEALVRAGIIGSLRGLVRAESQLVKDTLGRLCLNLVEEQRYRPIFVRDGGFRVLSNVVRDQLNPPSKAIKPDSPVDYLPAIQALAKLIITTPPNLLFPAPHLTTAINALTPLYTLLAHPSSTLLQQFEALMALTNIASIDQHIADRIVKAEITPPVIDTMWRGSGRAATVTVISIVEGLLLDNNTLVRRAATELVCNLVSSPAGYLHVTGDSGTDPDPKTNVSVGARIKSRLNVLLVLTSVDDTPTRLAAGGALAIVSESRTTCDGLITLPYGDQPESVSKRSPWQRLLSMLDPDSPETDETGENLPVISSNLPNPYLIHRAVIIINNLIQYIITLPERDRVRCLAEARKADVEERLLEVIKNQKSRDILEPTVETLKILKRYPAS